MKAIILSAGRGSRLLPHTESIPKCLLPLGARTVLEHQLAACIECGISEIVVITGFETRLVDAVLEPWQRDGKRDGVTIVNLYNPFFHVSDNLASCWMARAHMDGDFVLLNGDTMFEPEVLRRVLASPAAPVTVTIDRKAAYDADDMKVELEGDRLRAVSKGLPHDRVNGESIGMLLFRGEGPGVFVATLENAVREPAGLKSWFLKAIDDLAKTGAVSAFSIEGLTWAELDTPEDLESARAIFG